MKTKTVKDIHVHGKKVLVRVDFNVPLSSKNPADHITVTDDARIRAALPTLNYLLDQGAALILCSHLGRPSSAADKQYAMNPVADRLSELIGRPVQKMDEVVGPSVTAAVAAMQPGDIIMLENTRFEPGETKNNPELSQKLADLADVFVEDAFGSVHRAHSSTEGAARMIRAKGGPAVAGFLMGKELDALGTAVTDPPHPYVAIMGGAKISDKIKLIENLLKTADKILIGGGMANTFLKAQGHQVGKSLVEEDALPEAQRLLKTAANRIVLPTDVIVAPEFSADAPAELVSVWGIPPDQMALDVGPDTIERFNEELQGARLVVWNGPMGVFEFDRFAEGTNALSKLLAALTSHGVQVVIGGGDSAAAVRKAGLEDKMTHISTGGGASLELLEGKDLPGITVLDRI
ncbi:MAG: phosphoglycerate kinase [Chloroflexi bacterium]|nr:phosphoglycerate kinase [Chloroflexota bacterium]